MKEVNKTWLLILLVAGFLFALQANARQSATIVGCGSDGGDYVCPSGTYAFKGGCYLANDVSPTCDPQLFDCDTGDCIGQPIPPPTTTPTWIRVSSNYVASGDSNDKVSIGGTQPAADVRLVVGSGTVGANIIGINGAANDYAGLRIANASVLNNINEKWFIGQNKGNNFVVRSFPYDYLTINRSNGNIYVSSTASGAIYLKSLSKVNIANGLVVNGWTDTNGLSVKGTNNLYIEGGDLVIQGANKGVSTAVVTSSKYCIGSSCINNWNQIAGTNYWTSSAAGLYPNDLNQNVGIGTLTPDAKLEVYGRVSSTDMLASKEIYTNAIYSKLAASSQDKIWVGDFNDDLQIQGEICFGNDSTKCRSDWPAGTTYTSGKGISISGNTINSTWTTSSANIYSNNTGNVGIGTAAPAAKLDVAGNVKITDGTQADGRVLTSDANGLASWEPIASTSQWADVTGGINYAGGHVGIGTTAPQHYISVVVNDSTRADNPANQSKKPVIMVYNPNLVGDAALSEFSARTGGGAWNESARLGATGPSFVAVPGQELWQSDAAYLISGTELSNGLSIGASHSLGEIRFYTGGHQDNATVNNRRMTITSGGNVGIGTASPAEKLDVAGGIRIGASSVATPSAGIISYSSGDLWAYINDNDTQKWKSLTGGIDSAHNTVLGTGAILNSNNLTGYMYNTAVGEIALHSLTTGNRNTAVGADTLTSDTSGEWNTAVGVSSLPQNTTGSYNTAVGVAAMQYNRIGVNNSAVGNKALQNNTTGSMNSAFGDRALFGNNTGNNNVGVGQDVFFASQANSFNTGIGDYALNYLMLGNNNVAVGYRSAQTSFNMTNSVYIGANSKSANNDDNTIVIGYNAASKGANKITLGNTSITDVYTSGNINTTGNIKAGGYIQVGVDTTTLCNSATIGIIKYVEVGSVGKFVGCRRLTATTYGWVDISN